MEGVRIARPSDFDRLAELLRLGIEATGSARGASLYRHPHRVEAPETRLQAAIDDPDRAVLAGLVDDYVVGLAMVSKEIEGPAGPVGIVEELYVEEEARGVGVGEALLDTAVEWCRSAGCVGVDIAALPGDRAAKNLCERSGFIARMLVMHRKL